MESEDGRIFVKNLANFVRTHERALANALHAQRQRGRNDQPKSAAGSSGVGVGVASTSTSTSTSTSSKRLPLVLSRAGLSFPSARTTKSAKLALTPHHLFYLLSRFEDLGVDIGPMNVRMESLHSTSAGFSNYVSFIGRAPTSKGKQTDTQSLQSISSIRSVMSSMSSLWSSLTLSNPSANAEKRKAQYREDIRYLYSCFTKIPALKLSPDPRARMIAGFEEFPFDTAVPLFAFKNVSTLEISDVDFRQFHGWDRLAEQLRSLTVRRAYVDDPIDLLHYIVLDDMEKRRRRSFKTPVPTTPSTPGAPWPTISPKPRLIDIARNPSPPNSLQVDQRRHSAYGSVYAVSTPRGEASDGRKTPVVGSRQRSRSRTRPISSRQGSLSKPLRPRSSGGSSSSSGQGETPKHSSTELFVMRTLPPSKWSFLRHLSLAENGLTYLTIPSLAPVADTLQSLDLSSNLFSDFPDALASLTHLRALNISNCMVESLKSLTHSPLPAITTLNLRSNRLVSLAGIERLLSLERVDLRDNKLRDPTELGRLTAIPDIVDLFVVKNPFTRTHNNYRVTIFNLFRSTPGYVRDVTIDSLLPLHNEKKLLVDFEPEPAAKPVVRPPLDDDDDPQDQDNITGGPPTEAELRTLSVADDERSDPRRTHRRATSDLGPQTVYRKKRLPRRRVVQLSQAGSPSTPPALQTLLPASATYTASHEHQQHPPRTPSESDQPTTPSDSTPFHTAHTTQQIAFTAHQHQRPPPLRPILDSALTGSPTPAPKIRDPCEDDDDVSPTMRSPPHDISGDGSDLYKKRIETLKHDLGPNWLSALNEDWRGEGAEQQHQVAAGYVRQGNQATTTLAPAVTPTGAKMTTTVPPTEKRNVGGVVFRGRTLG